MSIVLQAISDNGVSKVWRKDDWVFKQQPKFLTDNEIWCLETLFGFGFVPYAEQVDIDLIRLEYIESKPVIDCRLFKYLMRQALRALKDNDIRHGDLTAKNILIKENHPYIIDFSESRLMCDPRKDKRAEGDDHWMGRTVERLCKGDKSENYIWSIES